MVAAFLEFLPRSVKEPLDLSGPVDTLFKNVCGENLGPIMQEILAMLIFLAIAAVLLLAGIGALFKASPQEKPPAGLQPPPADTRIRPS